MPKTLPRYHTSICFTRPRPFHPSTIPDSYRSRSQPTQQSITRHRKILHSPLLPILHSKSINSTQIKTRHQQRVHLTHSLPKHPQVPKTQLSNPSTNPTSPAPS